MSALVLVDWENIKVTIAKEGNFDPHRFSMAVGVHKLISWTKSEAIEIFETFLFAPLDTLYSDYQMFHEFGFTIVTCPRIPLAAERRTDTSDWQLIKSGKRWITHPDVTHLCLASGDIDFLPLVQEAKEKGLKFMVSAASEKALSSRLREEANKSLITNEKMVHIFDPTFKTA